MPQEPGTPEERSSVEGMQTDEGRYTWLRRYNVVAAVVHAAQAVAVVALATDFTLPVTASYLAGPPGTPRNYGGSLGGTPVFLGTSDPDPHIPFERVLETEAVLARMGATVEVRRYEGMASSRRPVRE